MKEDVKFPEFNKSKNIRTFFDEVNDWIDLTKKSDEIKESLFKRFDYPFFVEKRLLHSLESYQKMKESKIDPKTIEFFSPKMREILFPIVNKLQQVYEPREEDQRAVEFLTSYQPWPFDLNPENLKCYRKAIVGFGRERENYDFTKKFPRDLCEKYFQKDLRLAKLFSENKNDYFGSFLGYAEALEKGEIEAIKYDLQIRLLQFVTSKNRKFNSGDIVIHCEALNHSSRLNIADDWFITRIISNGYDSRRWEEVYQWLESYVDVHNLREKLGSFKPRRAHLTLAQLLADIDSLKVDTSSNSLDKKKSKLGIKEYINSNNIKALYHFTAASNLESIRKLGGLFSWKYLQNHSIFYEGGGNEDSKSQDLRKHLENYVRLSFCKDHPMSFHVRNRIKGELVLLEIDPSILFKEGVLVSDINAADNCAKIQEAAQGLESINYPATQRTYVNREDPDFKQHQAEILVPEIVPLSFIKKIINYG